MGFNNEIMKYEAKFLIMATELSQSYCDKILLEMDKHTDIPHSVFAFAFESLKGMELFCEAIKIGAYSQAASLLRQLTEKVAILYVLSKHSECYESFKKYKSLQLSILKKEPEAKQKANEIFNQKCQTKSLKQQDLRTFLEFGWLLECSDSFGPNQLYKIAGIEDIGEWRETFNSYVHNKVFCLQAADNLFLVVGELIYICASLFDYFMIGYHNISGFNFVVNGQHYRNEFEKLFTAWTAEKQKDRGINRIEQQSNRRRQTRDAETQMPALRKTLCRCGRRETAEQKRTETA